MGQCGKGVDKKAVAGQAPQRPRGALAGSVVLHVSADAEQGQRQVMGGEAGSRAFPGVVIPDGAMEELLAMAVHLGGGRISTLQSSSVQRKGS